MLLRNQVENLWTRKYRYQCCKFRCKAQTHFFSHDELMIVKIDFVGPLVDTAEEEAACMSNNDEDDTHTSFITI